MTLIARGDAPDWAEWELRSNVYQTIAELVKTAEDQDHAVLLSLAGEITQRLNSIVAGTYTYRHAAFTFLCERTVM
jgi:hypothetical protein